MNPVLAAFVGVVIAGIPAFMAGFFARRKTKAEATDVITQAAERVVLQLTAALDQATATAARLDAEVKELRTEIARLREVVRRLGGDPHLI